MHSFGDNLRHERETRGVSLEEISTATKISVRLLKAIETEEFERLPGGVFNVNFVRQYARHLGLDEEKTVNEFRRLTAPPPDSPVQRSAASEHDDEGRARRWMLAGLSLAVIVVAGGAYAWLSGHNSRASQAPAPRIEAPAPQATPPQPAVQQPAETPPAPAPQEQPPSPQPPAQDNPNLPVRVEIEATDRVWVSAMTDGQINFQENLEPQQTRVLAAQTRVRLRVGNAGALKVTLNGQAQPPLGPKGQVRTVILTPEGMRIVTPPSEDDAAKETP